MIDLDHARLQPARMHMPDDSANTGVAIIAIAAVAAVATRAPVGRGAVRL
ncbi:MULTISPECIES: hypothetical protein [unclassified Streptomyces]|nr:hypothetical protein [Streptomyces sp. NBC_01439]